MLAALRSTPARLRLTPYRQVITAFAAFLIVFFGVHALTDHAAAAMFAIVPVVIVGHAFGSRAGAAAGIVMILLTTVLLVLVGEPVHLVEWESFALVVLVFVGYTVGRLHDLTERLARQVAEREQTEKALRQSESRLRSILEHSYEGIVLVNEQGQIMVFNPAMEQITGFKAQDVLGQPAWEVWNRVLPEDRRTPEVQAYLKTQVTDLIQKGEFLWFGHETEYEYRHPDGRTVILEEHISPIKTDDAFILAGFCRDVTARRQSEKLNGVQRDLGILLSSTIGLSKALEQVLDAVCQFEAIDAGGVYLVDQASGDLHLVTQRGLSAAFVERSRFYGVDTPNAELVRKGQPLYGDYDRIRVTNDPVRSAENLHAAAIIPIHYEGEALALLNLASHSHDTIPPATRIALETIASQIGGTLARLHAEAALRDSEANMQVLFDTIDDLLFIVDPQGTVLKTNRVVELRMGYSAAEFRHLNVLDMHPPDQRVEAAATMAAISSGRQSVCTVPLMTRDGTLIPVETKVTRGIWDHQPALFGLTRDTTERQRIEQHALELAVEKERLRILANFVKDASHDFRTPLATISASLYMLEKSDDAVVHQRRTHVIGQQVQRITRLIDSMLMMTQLDSEVVLDVAPLDLNELMAGLASRAEPLAAEKNLTLWVEFGQEIPLVQANRDRLHLAVFKLVENAVQYTPAGGSVVLRTYFRDGWGVIEIQDSGIGIPAGDLPHIFKRFYRVDRARSSDTGGSGLGLAIARKIIDGHHGLIEVESTLGKGSTFRLCLPPQNASFPAVD
jgi:PAS domain S-box-containing protein